MKTVMLIPYWHDYKLPKESVSHRDTLKIGGHTLLERAVKISGLVSNDNEPYIFTSYEKIHDLIDDDLEYQYLQRDKNLDRPEVSIEDIIEGFIKEVDADIIVLMHPRCPFLKPSTISNCIEQVISNKYNSAFIASSYKKLAWFEGKPLNYSLKTGDSTQHLGQLEPVILESSAVYVFRKDLFLKTRHRVSDNPYIKIVGRFEGFEIDTSDDYKIAELIVNAGLDRTEN